MLHTHTQRSVLSLILTWGRGRRRVRPAAGCGPCWGWSGRDTAAVCVRCSTRCLRPPAESPACLETARSPTSNPPEGAQDRFYFRIHFTDHHGGEGFVFSSQRPGSLTQSNIFERECGINPEPLGYKTVSILLTLQLNLNNKLINSSDTGGHVSIILV